MKRTLILLLTSLWTTSSFALSIDLTESNNTPLGAYAEYLQETGAELSLEQVKQAHQDGRFSASDSGILSFGIGARPVWLRIQAFNPEQKKLLQRLQVETSWLDRLEVYFLDGGDKPLVYQTGDRYAYTKRPVEGRFFAFDHQFIPGTTTIYIRVETPDPMVIPVYLSTVEDADARASDGSYLYGFIYGVVVALLAYNLLLFLSLRAWRYYYFAVYLGAFLLMNMSYTGHAYMWIWPDYPAWQLWANHILILLFPMAGLLFATTFLNTRLYFPRLHNGVIAFCLIFGVAEVLAILAGAQALALIISFVFIFSFSITMVYMGSLSLLAGNQSAKYFLIASVAHVTGSSITAMTTWSLIPYSIIGYHAIEIGMMLDAILLAIALADQFRNVQEQRLRAEHLAMLDPLTGTHNRRGFYQLVSPLWNHALEQQHDMAIIMLDIDMFKSINDEYGHAQGDQILTLVAKSLKDSIRTSDVMARWGGEEFIVLLPQTPELSALQIAERFRQRISSMRIRANDKDINLTVSLGVAYTGQPQNSLDDFIVLADTHLYKAKNLGRNCVFPQFANG